MHLDPTQAERDRKRDTMLASYGWDTLRLGRDQLHALPPTPRTIRTMLTLRRSAPGSR